MDITFFLLSLLTFSFAIHIIHGRFVNLNNNERTENHIKSVEYMKIIGGTESVPHSHPYQAGLFIIFENKTQFCSGSLISREYVLTAAHCVDDGKNKFISLTAVLGAHNISDEEDGVRIQSTIVFTHPAWVASTLWNDLALVLLSTKAPINENIQVVNLPPFSTVDISFIHVVSTFSGWGKTTDVNQNLSEVLNEINLTVISNQDCSERYLGIIKEFHICTDATNKIGGCIGDAGGPLTANFEGRKIQIGILSFSVNFDCEGGWPSVYTRVSHHMDWISLVAGVNP